MLMLAIMIGGGVPMKDHDNWQQVVLTNGMRGFRVSRSFQWSVRDLRLLRARARIDGMSARETTTQEDMASLYRRAFAEYGTQALWNKRMLEDPTPEDALVVARALRIEGDRAARRIAEQIESACRAAL